MNRHIMISAHPTHYELKNYHLGDKKSLERDFSIRDVPRHQTIPYYGYDKVTKTLFIPRGYDESKLSTMFNVAVDHYPVGKPKRRIDFNMTTDPYDEYQAEMIRYLTGTDEYADKSFKAHQLVLSVPTRSGKTYMSIAACAQLRTRMLVVVHKADLRHQWYEDILQYTDLKSSQIIQVEDQNRVWDMVDHPEKYEDMVITIVTHRMCDSIITKHGGDALGVFFDALEYGIKVIDETHLEFHNTLEIDYYTNAWKTFYLTATFGRGDYGTENAIFQRSFDHVVKMSKTNPNRKRNVVLINWGFDSGPMSYMDRQVCFGQRGFNRYMYAQYELDDHHQETVVSTIVEYFLYIAKINGRIVVLSPLIETCNTIADYLSKQHPNYKVCSYTSESKDVGYDTADIVCATAQMLGTGITIPNLKVMVNLEPTQNPVNLIQVFGRLNVAADGSDLYFVNAWDYGFSKVKTMYTKATKILESKAKNVINFGINIKTSRKKRVASNSYKDGYGNAEYD